MTWLQETLRPQGEGKHGEGQTRLEEVWLLTVAPLALQRHRGISRNKERTVSLGANMMRFAAEWNTRVLDYLMSLAVRGMTMRLLSPTGTAQGVIEGRFY